ncbi:MAG: ABC transporter permease [Ruminococcaceae bacterium]|nr:ABC transporter permease [Oscillospiraceae bacterium]
MEKNSVSNIPKELLQPADGNNVSGTNFGTEHHVGYLRDAWSRFRKNKASILATVIIALIVIFALIIPLFSTQRSLDSYYAKKGPYIASQSSIPLFDGGQTRTFNSRGLIHAYSIALGACDTTGSGNARISDITSDCRTVITPIEKVLDSRQNGKYKAKIDTYAEVGFVYMQISKAEYENIRKWEQENSATILFPLIANNEYNPNPNDANYWYMADTTAKNSPIDINGNIIKLSQNMRLYDNYLRDLDGNAVYFTQSGSSDNPSYKVRVLYKNYYTYINGTPPRYILGTDSQGYDMARRLSEGIRLSLALALSVSLINLIIGAIYGAIEGYYGGIPDLVLERISDILSCVPFIVVATLFQIHLSDKVGKIPSLLFAFVLTGWISIASRVRTQFYRFKTQEYVMSARTLGASDKRIILKHIFPNALGTIVTSSVLIIPTVILNESMLSFLGIVSLGSSDTTSLGTLLSEASNIWTSYPHLMILPALVISLLMICFNLFGNGLRDALNPSLRGIDS